MKKRKRIDMFREILNWTFLLIPLKYNGHKKWKRGGPIGQNVLIMVRHQLSPILILLFNYSNKFKFKFVLKNPSFIFVYDMENQE